jgi:hypothetical protein
LPEHRFAALLTEEAETLLCRVSQRTNQVADAAAGFLLDVERAVQRRAGSGLPRGGLQ